MTNDFSIKHCVTPALNSMAFVDHIQQGKSEGFDSCDRPSNLTQIEVKLSIFQPVSPSGFPQKSQKKVPWLFHDFSRPKSKFPDTKYQHKLSEYLLLQPTYQFIKSITDICMDIHVYTWLNQSQPTIQLILQVIKPKLPRNEFAKVESAVSK